MTSLKTLQTSIAWTMLHRTKKNTLTGLPKSSYLIHEVFCGHPQTWKLEHRHGPTISITIIFWELLLKVQWPKGWGGRVPGVHYSELHVICWCNGDTILADRGLHASIETLYRAGGKCDSCGAKQAVHNNSQFFRGTSSEIHCEGEGQYVFLILERSGTKSLTPPLFC